MTEREHILRARWVITGDARGTVYAPGEVGFRGETLTYVGPPRERAEGQIIELGEGAIAPGLYNGHNHAAMSLMRGLADDSRLMPWLEQHVWPVEAHMTEEDAYVGTLLSAAEMIRSGTVGFADMYGFVGGVVRAAEESGLRAAVAWGLVGDWPADGSKLEEAVAFSAAVNRRGGRVAAWLGPHAPYTCTPAFLEAVADAARRHHLPLHIHLAESAEEIALTRERYGLTPVELARRTGILTPTTLVAHAVYLEDGDIEVLKSTGAGVIHCPASNLKLGNGTARVTDLLAAGVAVGLGTDGPASTNSLDLFQEMRLAAWLQKSRRGDPEALPARQALSLATSGSARVMGLGGGVLEAGRPADLIGVQWWQPHVRPVLDPVSTLVYATHPGDVRYTVVGGQFLMDDGVITTFDEGAVLREASARAESLLRRAGQWPNP
jgi:5-methylthioadenosine/S-adenosylhomocysteine deaminase